MRNIFEFLVIGKYILLNEDKQFQEKWNNIENINLDRKIFNNTIYPNNHNKEAFLRWWKLLCQYTHATRASGQIDFECENLEHDIKVNLSFLFMLLCMVYHYMNSYLATPYFKTYIKSLADDQPKRNDNIQKAIKYEQEIKEIIKTRINPFLSMECRHIIQYYRAKWRFTPNF